MRRAWRALLLAAASFLLTGVAPAPVKLAAHRAQYEMTLAEGSRLSGPVGIRGRMVVEFSNSCDGFTTTQRMIADMSDAEERTSRSDFVAVAWESADGRKLRFRATNRVDGKTVDHFDGRAEGGLGSKSGRAVYTAPKSQTVPLPADTLFPTEFMTAVIAAAREGNSRFSHTLFGGDDPSDVYEATAYIGKEVKGPDGDGRKNPLLKGKRSWPVVLSYYTARKEAPDYEMSFRLYENGISTGLRMSYPEFALTGRLSKLEAIPSKC